MGVLAGAVAAAAGMAAVGAAWLRWRSGDGAHPERAAEPVSPALKLPIRTLQLGDHRIIELCAESPSGLLYRGRAANGAPCLIKLPTRLCLEDAENLRRFERESQILDTLRHPGIIKKLAAGEVAERGTRVPYLVLEHREGSSLREVLTERGALPLETSLRYLHQIALALDSMHGAGVTHRNLGPDALHITDDGQAIVHSFGVARALTMETITLHGQIVGAVEYIAPEQIYGKSIDGRVDLYSLGVVAYHMLTGRSPFAYTSIASLIKLKSVPQGPRPGELCPGVPEEVDLLIAALMSADPEQRPAPAHHVASILLKALKR